MQSGIRRVLAGCNSVRMTPCHQLSIYLQGSVAIIAAMVNRTFQSSLEVRLQTLHIAAHSSLQF